MKVLLILALVLAFHGVRSCNHHGTQKYVGQICKDDSECYNGGSTDSVSCKSGMCACNDGYLAQMQWFTPKEQNLVCLLAPYQDQSCTEICQKPFTCASSLVPGMKTCQCRPPAISKDGVCYLECASDEVFEGGECRKRCEIDENKDHYMCKKMGMLGEMCSSKDLCYAPFSQCVDGICSCGNGFVPNIENNACESSQRWCPIGDPIRGIDDGKINECKITKRQSIPEISKLLLPFPQPKLLEDNCAEDQYCMLTSGDVYYVEGATGHCCQKPKLQCPYGQPHPNATCGQPIPYRESTDRSFDQYCPYGTHSCVRFAFGGGYEESLCCPVACGSNQILSGGICYPKRSFGDKCEIDEQCRSQMGICSNGTCACDKDYVVDGGFGYFYCRRVCKDNEVLVDAGRCLPILKLGDKCDPQYGTQCPTNSYCSTETKVCDCFCGYVEIDGKACGPQPVCPDVMAGRDPSVLDASINLTSITLCSVAPKAEKSFATAACPSGQYCSSYISEYGLCCPMPEKPFCPNGAAAGEECDPQEPMPCGPLGYCYRYLNPASNAYNLTTSACCSILAAPMPIFNASEIIG